MSFWSQIKAFFGPNNAATPPAYPKVTTRKSIDEERPLIPDFKKMAMGMSAISAHFPFEIYEIIDSLSLIDPYVHKFLQTCVSLGNTGHNLVLDAKSQARAEEAISVANQFAARAFPLGGGLDGICNAMFHQIARSGGVCVEWVPDNRLTLVERGFLVPMKTIRWVYNRNGEMVLCQVQGMDMVPLNRVQTSFHNMIARDTNPYPVPPAIAGLEHAGILRNVILKVKDWMEKVSAMGVLLATIERPPRNPGETQAEYDNKAQQYLDKIAATIQENMSNGIGVGYDNITFQFNNTQASAQGAKDVLQIVLQGLFAGLQTDPIFMGWNFNTTETFAKVVYEEMQQRIKTYQLGVKRALEHAHRLNFAMQGLGDIGISVQFKSNRSLDAFRDAEAEMMMTKKYCDEIEAGIITPEEARKFLGYEDKAAEAGEFVTTFNRKSNLYEVGLSAEDERELDQRREQLRLIQGAANAKRV